MDPGQTAVNARKAAADPNTVYYIGEFNSGAMSSYPDPEQRRNPAGQPREHVCGPDDE